MECRPQTRFYAPHSGPLQIHIRHAGLASGRQLFTSAASRDDDRIRSHSGPRVPRVPVVESDDTVALRAAGCADASAAAQSGFTRPLMGGTDQSRQPYRAERPEAGRGVLVATVRLLRQDVG